MYGAKVNPFKDITIRKHRQKARRKKRQEKKKKNMNLD